ncbi:MAG: hypothetical protein GX444_07885 [Myxococcales bacterium]|nr:hypothetical protein [Myxococcales bacterium]
MRHVQAIFLTICLALGLLVAAAGCQNKKAPAPEQGLPDLTPQPREELVAALQKQIAKAERTDAGNPEMLEKSKASYFGCLEKNKNDDCRFLLCSPYPLYAGDEYFQQGNLDDAFVFYTASYDLMKEEIAANVAKRNQREAELKELTDQGKATDRDRRRYFLRRAILSHSLYRDYAEVARILERYALIFDQQNKTEEAKNARTTAEAFISTSADEYAEYFAARRAIIPLLGLEVTPDDPDFAALIKDLDSVLEVRHF